MTVRHQKHRNTQQIKKETNKHHEHYVAVVLKIPTTKLRYVMYCTKSDTQKKTKKKQHRICQVDKRKNKKKKK